MTLRPTIIRAILGLTLLLLTLGQAPALQLPQPKDEDILTAIEQATGLKVSLAKEEKALLEDARDGKLDSHSFAEAALLASGVLDGEKRQAYLRQLDKLTDEARKAVATGRTPAEQAERLLEWMHSRCKKHGYRGKQTDLPDLLETGTYNCVSATVLYNIVGERLGLDVRAIQIPGHVFSVVYDGMRAFEVETTNPKGFNPERKEKPPKERREIRAIGLVALVYSNHVATLDKEKRHAEALHAGLCAVGLDAECATVEKNAVAVFVNWSAELGRAQQYEEAVLVATVGLKMTPGDRKLLQNREAALVNWVGDQEKKGAYREALITARRYADRPQQKKLTQHVYETWARGLVDAERWAEAAEVLKEAREAFPKDRLFKTWQEKCAARLGSRPG